MITVCGFSSISQFIALSCENKRLNNFNFYSTDSSLDHSIHIHYQSHLYGKGEFTFMLTKHLCKSNLYIIACNRSKVVDYLERINELRERSSVILIQNGLFNIDNSIFKNLRISRASLGKISTRSSQNILYHLNANLPLLSLDKATYSYISRYNRDLISLSSILNIRVVSSELLVIWEKLIRSGPHCIVDLFIKKNLFPFQGLSSYEFAKIIFSEYHSLATKIYPNFAIDYDINENIVLNLVDRQVQNSASFRILNSNHKEELYDLILLPYHISVNIGHESPLLECIVNVLNTLDS